jgi:hypothetical protein
MFDIVVYLELYLDNMWVVVLMVEEEKFDVVQSEMIVDIPFVVLIFVLFVHLVQLVVEVLDDDELRNIEICTHLLQVGLLVLDMQALITYFRF